MCSYKICKIFKNTFFEEHLQTTASVDNRVSCSVSQLFDFGKETYIQFKFSLGTVRGH